MTANFISTVPLAGSPYARSGPTRGSHSCHGLEAVYCWPLDLDRYAGGGVGVGQQVSIVRRALGATAKKPFAWISQGVLGTNRSGPGASYCLTRG